MREELFIKVPLAFLYFFTVRHCCFNMNVTTTHYKNLILKIFRKEHERTLFIKRVLS